MLLLDFLFNVFDLYVNPGNLSRETRAENRSPKQAAVFAEKVITYLYV